MGVVFPFFIGLAAFFVFCFSGRADATPLTSLLSGGTLTSGRLAFSDFQGSYTVFNSPFDPVGCCVEPQSIDQISLLAVPGGLTISPAGLFGEFFAPTLTLATLDLTFTATAAQGLIDALTLSANSLLGSSFMEAQAGGASLSVRFGNRTDTESTLSPVSVMAVALSLHVSPVANIEGGAIHTPTLTFHVIDVPEPSAVMLLSLGVVWGVRQARQLRSRSTS